MKIKTYFKIYYQHRLNKANFFIITVPTPVKRNFTPDLKSLRLACKTVGKRLKKNDIVFIESTIYPSVTQKICLKILLKSP